MNRLITWGSVAGAAVLLIALYFSTIPKVNQVTTKSPAKEKAEQVVAKIKESIEEVAEPIVEAQAAEDNSSAETSAGDQELSEAIREIASWYGPQNSAMYVNVEFFNNAPPEIVRDVFDRWYNIDEGYLDSHPHWHKEDRSDVTFENFTSSFYFFPADAKFSTVTAVCKNRQNYSEILLNTDQGKWLDLNQGGADHYSISLWEWYNTVAIKSGNETFIHHSKPVLYRWNAAIPEALANEILRTGEFEIFVESNQYRSRGIMMNKTDKEKYKVFPNLNLKATVTIQNIGEVRGCFDIKKPKLGDY